MTATNHSIPDGPHFPSCCYLDGACSHDLPACPGLERLERELRNDEARIAHEIDAHYERGVCAPDW